MVLSEKHGNGAQGVVGVQARLRGENAQPSLAANEQLLQGYLGHDTVVGSF